MKVQEANVNIERGENMVESMFGISGKDSAHILNILRSKLYSNKILAVVREYCANAQDAHAEAGKDSTPIEVHLPTILYPTFRVRDYGLGLSEDDVRNIYVMYGASTKRTTNKAIGQLGLGCKSAFAYTEKFHVISWNTGEKKTYCAYIDETQCGKIALLATEKTEEPNGIEIQIPVNQNDFNNFKNEAEKLLKYFNPIPDITGVEIETPLYWLQGTISNNVKFCCHKLDNDSNRYGYTNRQSYIIMGGIPYPISTRANQLNFTDDDNDTKLKSFLNLGVDLYINIGDAEVTANREELEYTDYTIKTLTSYINEAANKAIVLGTTEITTSPTYRDANIKYVQMSSTQSFWKNANKLVTWNNKPLDGLMLQASNLFEIFQPVQYTKRVQWNEQLTINATANVHLFDIDNDTSWKRKLIEYITYTKIPHSQVRVIKWSGDDDAEQAAARAQTYKERVLDEYGIKPISQCKIPASALPAIQNAMASIRSTTHLGTVFLFKPPSERQMYARSKSKQWTRVDKIPSDKKYYIEIDRFLPKINGHTGCTVGFLDKLIKTIRLTETSIDYKNIYGIKRKQVMKVTKDQGWIALDIIGKEIIEKSKTPLEVADTIEFNAESTDSTEIYAISKNLFPAKSDAFKLLDEVDRLQKIHTRIDPILNDIRFCMNKLGLDIPAPSVKLKPLLDIVKGKYPLASISKTFPYNTSSYSYTVHDKETIRKALPHVVEYVKFIENSKEKVA